MRRQGRRGLAASGLLTGPERGRRRKEKKKGKGKTVWAEKGGANGPGQLERKREEGEWKGNSWTGLETGPSERREEGKRREWPTGLLVDPNPFVIKFLFFLSKPFIYSSNSYKTKKKPY